jgi:hypothetical protein
MKRTLLFILPLALISLTGCSSGPFGFFHRGDRCQQPCSYEASCSMQSACHSGVLGGTIVSDGGMETIIEGPNPGTLPGPAGERVMPGQRNP